MKTTFTPAMLVPILESLASANAAHDRLFPGEPVERQPVHVVYGGAHLFKAETATTLGSLALDLLRNYVPDFSVLAKTLPESLYQRVLAKLEREPVEDFRIDFEDGYGNRPDAEEDGHAESAALEVVRGLAVGTLPPFIGIRIKPFNEELRARSMRTLDIFVSTVVAESGGRLP